jgi:outer membrane biosynthesis protein TonB
MSAEVSASPLLFNWQPPRPRKLSIIAFLCGSLLLHGICFYLFQIVYAPAIVLLPPPAHVTLITADSEEGRSILRWVDAEDPALASATQRSPEWRQRALPKIQHIPSYVAEGPKLKEAPPLVIDTRPPSAHPPGPVPLPRAAPSPSFARVATRISFSDEVSSQGVPQMAPALFTASNHETPQAVRFRIAVGPDGEVRHCFQLNSSGDSALDEQARHQIVLTRFHSAHSATAGSDQPDVWGIATVEWGNDVRRPADGKASPP